MKRKFLQFLIFFALIPAFSTSVYGYVAGSSNYRIQFDSVNFGGGLSNSATYYQESTFGELATNINASTNYNLKSGYQQMNTVAIAISAPADITLSPAINGLYGGAATGEAGWNVRTDSSAGYTLAIKASTDPALQVSASDYFSNYTVSGSVPDYSWSVSASANEFGFTPEGTDIATRYKDNGSACNQSGGSDASDACWDAISTSNVTIASASSGNSPTGATTTVKFKAEVGGTALKSAGSFSAVITLTALAL